jgi:MSHA pilin protein MshC
MRASERGFTLLEMVAVITVVGILAVFATGAFQRTGYDAAAYADVVQTTLAHAHRIAVAQRSTVTVTITTAQISIDAPGPDGSNAPFVRNAPGGVALAPATVFTFNGLGKPSAGPIITVAGGGTSRTITVEPETGYVHR